MKEVGKRMNKTGEGKYTFSNGSVYEGSWKNGKLHGLGTFGSNGEKITGDFKRWSSIYQCNNAI